MKINVAQRLSSSSRTGQTALKMSDVDTAAIGYMKSEEVVFTDDMTDERSVKLKTSIAEIAAEKSIKIFA